MSKNITVRGAREHNLKNVTVELHVRSSLSSQAPQARANPPSHLTQFTLKANAVMLRASQLTHANFWK